MEEKTFEIEVPDFDEITDDGVRMLFEKTVRSNGVWRSHKLDPDCIFPSDFHAHRVDDAETLDIYTGQVYCPKTKTQVRTMPKKAMKYIYNQFSNSKEPEFIAKCANKKKFTFL
jgi:hypothetical protein